MKRILIVTVAIGVFLSTMLFLWGWKGMEKTYLIPKQLAQQEFCNQLEICQKCNRGYECLKDECDKNSISIDRCQTIEENWEKASLELTPEDFVLSICGKDDDFYSNSCLVEQSSNFKLKLGLALSRIPYNLGISEALLFLGIYNLELLGIIILFIPPILGFLIGLTIGMIKIKNK